MKKILTVVALALLILSGCSKPSSTKTITVGLECDYAPFNWTQVDKSETAVALDGAAGAGYCDGYDITVAKAIAKGLNRTLVVKKISWDGLVPALTNNDIDMIVAGMTDTVERRNAVNFTDAYYASNMVLIVRKDSTYAKATSLADFAKARVIAQKNTFHDGLIDQISNVVHNTPLTTFPLLVNSVVSKDSDAMVSELPVAQSIVATNSQLQIIEFAAGKGFTTTAEDTTVSVALRKADTQLQIDINAILAKITAETRTQWMTEALSRQPESK